MNTTPIIQADKLKHIKSYGEYEFENGDYTHLCLVKHDDAFYMLSGGACNAGLLAEHARVWDKGFESEDEALQEFVADLEEVESGCPSEELLRFHGSLVI
jgi:hypothetical protein